MLRWLETALSYAVVLLCVFLVVVASLYAYTVGLAEARGHGVETVARLGAPSTLALDGVQLYFSPNGTVYSIEALGNGTIRMVREFTLTRGASALVCAGGHRALVRYVPGNRTYIVVVEDSGVSASLLRYLALNTLFFSMVLGATALGFLWWMRQK